MKLFYRIGHPGLKGLRNDAGASDWETGNILQQDGVPVETWDLPVAGSPTVEMAMPVIHYQNIQSAPNFAAHESSRYLIKNAIQTTR